MTRTRGVSGLADSDRACTASAVVRLERCLANDQQAGRVRPPDLRQIVAADADQERAPVPTGSSRPARR